DPGADLLRRDPATPTSEERRGIGVVARARRSRWRDRVDWRTGPAGPRVRTDRARTPRGHRAPPLRRALDRGGRRGALDPGGDRQVAPASGAQGAAGRGGRARTEPPLTARGGLRV